MNTVNFIGNLVRDPELKAVQNSTEGGTHVAKFTIAINSTYGKKEASFFDIECWGKLAENVAKYQKKGSKVGIIAEAQQNRYDDKDGNHKSRIVFRAKSVDFLSPATATPALSTAHMEILDKLVLQNQGVETPNETPADSIIDVSFEEQASE